MKLIIVAECYANKCVAQSFRTVLNNMLREKLGEAPIATKVRHNYKYGRDRIVKELAKLANRNTDAKILAIIDYETGISRVFIDNNFDLYGLKGYNSILVGRYRRSQNILAIVFDPNIEKALICSIEKSLCNPDMLKRVKSDDACSALRPLFGKQSFNDILQQMANHVLSILSIQSK